LTVRKGYGLTEPLEVESEPEEPDVRYVVNLGLNGPTYSQPTDSSMSKGRYYMDVQGSRRSWYSPSSPLYLTKGTCGKQDIPVIDVPENAKTVELVINNLSPAAHVLQYLVHSRCLVCTVFDSKSSTKPNSLGVI
jgi:hypothetical protein